MDDGVLEAARSIRWYLPELVGPATEAVDRQLAELLDAAAGDEDVRGRVRAVLDVHEGTRAFLAAVLDDAPEYRPPQVQSRSTRGTRYSALAGEQGPIGADKFRCPCGDFVWYRQAVGVPAPACATHHCALVPA